MSSIDTNKAALALCENQAFLDIMRVLHNITGYDTWALDGADTSTISKLNGKREVWGQLKLAMNLPPEVLTKIEHFKQLKDD